MLLNVIKNVKKYERSKKRKKNEQIFVRQGALYPRYKDFLFCLFFNERKKIF